MSRFELWIGLILLLSGCDSNKIKIAGEISDLQGEMKLLTVLPVSLDTLRVTGQKENTQIEWIIPHLDIPARVWLEVEGKYIADFILDEKKEMRIVGTIQNDSLIITGGKLENEYTVLKQFLKENYQQPIEKIDRSIGRMISRANRTRSEEKRLDRLITLKGRYEYYRNVYIEKLIRKNLSHELSLVLIEEELKDSLALQKRLFKELTVENKNSNLYKTLEKRLQ